jgi:hydroxypyruvate reductase
MLLAALEAVVPGLAIQKNLVRSGSTLLVGDESYDLDKSRLFLVGAGKASIKMGIAAWKIVGDLVHRGTLVTKASDSDEPDLDRLPPDFSDLIEVFWASHPVSDQRGIQATSSMIEMLSMTTSNDLVLCLISGGASALLTQPTIPLPDWQQLVSVLLASGCTINELNAVRRRIDLVKGGGLLKYGTPKAWATLILSDVVGNPLDVIGSGPTVPVDEDPQMARRILERYGVQGEVQSDVWQRLETALDSRESRDQIDFPKVNNHIVGDVRMAADAAEKAAVELGFSTSLLTCNLEGEAREVGRVAAALTKDAPANSCLIMGGETTVTVTGDGAGGRNQELVLAAAIALEGQSRTVVASFSTDGEDGPTTSAGAFTTGETASTARGMGIDPLDQLSNNNSHGFFSEVGGLLNTGPTGTNVNDLLIILKYDV